jgi:predicted DNA-binding transcriptional regulator YafY
MNRTDRLYAIAEELRAAGARGRTAGWLAARFEVSARTVKRDVLALQEAGVPVWGEGGPGGGYVLDAGATLPPMTFTPGEATAIAAALATQPGLPFGPDGHSALAKVLAAMPAARQDEAGSLAGRVWIRPGDAPARTAASSTVDEGLRAGRVVVLDYVDGDGQATTRRPVEPLAYAHDRGRWYLLAWCRRRRAGRWFRIDRIARATLTTESFPSRSLRDVFGEPPAGVVAVALRPE